MSPYKALCNLPADQFEIARGYARRYFEHWSSLLGAPLPDEAVESLSGLDLETTDARTREAIFNRESDPFWMTIDTLAGKETVDQILCELASQPIQTPV